jgi:hypothetical protein
VVEQVAGDVVGRVERAAFVAPYVARRAPPAHAAPDVTMAMPPRPRATIRPPKWWAAPSTVVQLRANIACQTSTGWSRKRAM